MLDAAAISLPLWARVTDSRRGHIIRVTKLLERWAEAMQLPGAEADAWRDAGIWHDALRDAPEDALRALLPDADYPGPMLHGPACALRLARDGEKRTAVLEAIKWHTVGYRHWDRTGKALFMADYLEPGRPFARPERAFLASQVPHDFEGVFRQVVRHRLDWALRDGKPLYPETVALWNALR
jgi:2-amino-4-hydroxy-6-hydroxymethyldihydropteridine diphosphokinase